MWLTIAGLIVFELVDYFESLPGEGEGYGRLTVDPCGDIRVVGNFDDINDMLDEMRHPWDQWNRDSEFPCSNATPIGLGVNTAVYFSDHSVTIAPAHASDPRNYPEESWYFYQPTHLSHPGAGPWPFRLSIGESSLGASYRPTIRVYQGYCPPRGALGPFATANLGLPVIEQTAPGCYEFENTARDTIFVRVNTATGSQLAQSQISIADGSCISNPGDTCAEAATISEGVTYGPFTVGPAASHWFAVPFVAFSYAKITITVITASGTNSVTLSRGECATLTETTLYLCPGAQVEGDALTNNPGNQGFSSLSAHEGSHYVSVNAESEGTLEYSIRVDRGNCL